MTTPPSSPPPPPTTDATSHSLFTLKRTRKSTHLRSLTTRPIGAERPLVHVDPVTGKADGTHKKKFRTYLGIIARDKVDVTYENWKQVPAAQKDLIWEDIQAEFDIPEASDLRTKKKILQIVGHLQPTRTVSMTLFAKRCVKKGTGHSETKHCPSHVVSWGYEFLEKKLMDKRKKKQLEEATQSRSTDIVIDPSSPIRQHMKWKMTHTKKSGQMTSKAVKEIADKIDVSTATIGRPGHPGRVRTAGVGVTIKQYFGSAPRTSRSSSFMALKDLEQLTQKIRDQLEESITKKSCGNPSRNDPDIGDSEKYGLYVEENPPRLVALERLYEESTTVHTIPLRHDQVKVGVKEVRDADAPIPVPTEKVMWDATVFGVFNDDFLLYIKHENLSEIA
ncbi:hypothetical protein GmHk_08G023520 [Glycine max]|nr:hypothetical protein GmHk_08G023520 [Glycine max]